MSTVYEKIYEYPDEDRETLLSAYRYAEMQHEGQKRASGEIGRAHV